MDFGWFYFLTKPIFYCLDWLNGLLGNFGLAIMVFTVFAKALFFPLANYSYRSMRKMKLLAPKMTALREPFKDEPAHAARDDGDVPHREGELGVAFAGRSNVGKSSLLNALTGRRALARVSGEPGRTRQLNFFDLGGRLTLVDMPGYGYASASRAVKQDWQGLMFDYLRGRATLRRVMLLLDARIEVKDADNAVMELLDRAAVTFQVVLTKADSVKPAALGRKHEEARVLARAHPAAHPDVIATSSETGLGIAELRGAIAGLVE